MLWRLRAASPAICSVYSAGIQVWAFPCRTPSEMIPLRDNSVFEFPKSMPASPLRTLLSPLYFYFYSCGLSLPNLHGMVKNLQFSCSEFGFTPQSLQSSGLTRGCLLARATQPNVCSCIPKYRHKPRQEMGYDINYRKHPLRDNIWEE